MPCKHMLQPASMLAQKVERGNGCMTLDKCVFPTGLAYNDLSIAKYAHLATCFGLLDRQFRRYRDIAVEKRTQVRQILVS